MVFSLKNIPIWLVGKKSRAGNFGGKPSFGWVFSMRQPNKGLSMLEIHLPKEIEQRLTSLATITGRTKEFYIREATIAHLEDLEGYYLAASISARIAREEEPTYNKDEASCKLLKVTLPQLRYLRQPFNPVVITPLTST